MVPEGYWRWAAGGAYEDVPLSNFLGWAPTGLGGFALWAGADPWDEPEVNGTGALRLYAWTWIGETYANAALWKRPGVALAGAAARGAFALPALRGRWGPSSWAPAWAGSPAPSGSPRPATR